MHPDKDSLIKIVENARQGKVVLPEFQRSFIWKRREIEELIVSVFNDYFIGSLLTLNVVPDSIPFKPRIVEGVDGVLPRPHTMVLDGQQRITSIHYALYGPNINLKGTAYPYRFFVDIGEALNERWDEAVYSRPTYYKLVDSLFNNPKLQYQEGCIALSALRSWEAWTAWRDGYRDYLKSMGKPDDPRLNLLMEPASRFLNFQVAVITMSRSTPLPTVVEVFERINRTGAQLGVFDLLTARLWGDGIALRDLWNEALERNVRLRSASDPKSDRFQRFTLQVIALLRGKECKRKELILLEGESFREDWNQATDAMESAFERIESTAEGGYGVIPKLSAPYSTMIAPLALMLAYVGKLPGAKVDGYDKLDYWYWSSVFRERYGGSTESTSYRDIRQIKAWIGADEAVPEAVPTHRAELKRDLTDVVRVGAVYRGILSLVALRGATDFFTGQSIELHELDDHHIFPKSFFKNRGVSQDRRNTIVNRTLISSDTNRRIIRAKRPSIYLKEMEKQLGRERVRKILGSHFIDDAAIEAMRVDDYGAFVDARERALQAEVVRRCVYSKTGAIIEADEGLIVGEENARLDRLEAALRDLIDETLQEVAGDKYWRQLVPQDTRAGVARRLQQETERHPRAHGGPRPTHRKRLDFCDFSDYTKIILQKNVWPKFEQVFARRSEFERHMTSAMRYRNALKHGREVGPVDHLAGRAAIMWLEKCIGSTRFSERVSAGEEVTVEDCLRVLTRRVVPLGQRSLYRSLVESGPQGLTARELAVKMGREALELAGVMGALGRRINNTPGYGATHDPGTGMLLRWDGGKDGGRYRLRSVLFQALREFAPPWLSESELAAFEAAAGEAAGSKGGSGSRGRPSPDDGLTETKRTYLRFWTVFKPHVEAHSKTLRPQTPRPDHWTRYAIGRTGCSLEAVASFWNAADRTYDTNELRAEIVIEGDGSHERFDTLAARRDEIVAMLGFELIWEKVPDRSKCRAYARATVDLGDREAWAEHRGWLLTHLEALDRVFRPLVAEFD